MSRDHSNDIGVLGVSARFPGPSNLEDWFQALLKGEVFTTRYTREELLAAGVQETLADDPEYIPVRGHLENTDRFDNKFFRVSNRDAEMMDPQHRLMLEAAWSALEDSGYGRSDDRPVTGVFASGSGSGYMRTMLSRGPLDPEVLEQVIHGTEPDFIASLISYKLNLTGPAVAVQTACSSSLVGLHLAIQALRNGDCVQALVVASGIPFPQSGHLHIPGGINSGSGVCRPFDKNADGVLEGSGVACVVLRRLIDIPDEAPELHGVILGTAINNDGSAKAGYFAPSISGQVAVIQDAIRAANVNATSIGYLEAHGTGTHIGDPIEWTATSEAYKELGAQPGQIAIGALKANVGHLDAVSGLASLIKTMRVVKEGLIPPLANFESLNPYMQTKESPLCINDSDHSWPKQKLRRAAISAFGIGGTNAHVIIEQPNKPEDSQITKNNKILVIPLSAGDPESLNRSAQLLKDHLIKKNPELGEVSYTLSKGRTMLSERLVVCGRSSAEIAEKLNNGEGIFRGQAPVNSHKPVIFLFPGQGSQFPGMAIPFISVLPGFSDVINSCLSLFETKLRNILRCALFDSTFPEDKLNQTEIAQPALFALEYAIAASLISLGINPIAVAGHSLGEITAAYLAGAFSLKDAVEFVTKRGKSMQSCPTGALLAVNCNESELNEFLKRSVFKLYVSAINTPESCVVAGKSEDIKAFQAFLGNDVISRILKTNRAFHSPLIEPALKSIESVLEMIKMRFTQIPIALNVTGEVFEKGGKLDTKYFLKHASQTVNFSKSLQEISKRFPDAIFIEVGPGKVLSSMASSLNLESLALSPGRSNHKDVDVLTTISALWTHGFPLDLSIFSECYKRIHLPTYPFFGPKWMAPEAAAGLKIKKSGSDHLEYLHKVQIEKKPLIYEKSHDIKFILSKLWAELLSCHDIMDGSDFFILGGDSLLITSLIRKVNQIFDIKVPPRKMLSARTLAAQVLLIKDTLAT